MTLAARLKEQVIQDEAEVRLARAMVGQRDATGFVWQRQQQGLDELEQVVDLLELAARVLVELAVAGEDMQRLQQLNRLAGPHLGGQCVVAHCYFFHSELSNPNKAQPAKPRSVSLRRLRSKISAASGMACTARAMLSSRSRCSVG